MCWKKLICLFVGVGLIVIGLTSPVFAHIEQHRSQIKVQAPVDAINCQTTPATLSLLGLGIDVSKASFVSEWHDGYSNNLACADLMVGQVVEVNLLSDTTDPVAGLLTATKVEVPDDYDNGVMIVAPLQVIDPTGTNVTVLGLTIDISNATLLNDKRHPIVVSQLKAGQIAMLKLASNQAPLSATKLLVHINQVKVQAPLDAINCLATPATLSMLGFNIDISKAIFSSGWHENSKLYPKCEDNFTCASLTVGQTVEIYLTSDTPDLTTGLLTATEVDEPDGYDNPVTIVAPLQAIDPTGANVTVLGLLVDISDATLLNDEEEPIMLVQIKAGQFASLELLSNQVPLSADTLLVHINEIKVRAALDAINCQAVPATVSMLGLNIDISNAGFDSGWHDESGLNPRCEEVLTCTSLTVGQSVVIELVGDTADPVTGLLTATEIEVQDEHDNDVAIAAPIQIIDPIGLNVTVLGLPVDISKATLLDDKLQLITPSQLVVGQFVDLDLASGQAPLSANLLVAESGTNEFHIFVLDEKGKQVNDADNDVKAEVKVTVAKKVLKIQASSNGAFHLAALPAGRATIAVTRVHNGKTSRATASFKVTANTKNNLNIKLKAVK